MKHFLILLTALVLFTVSCQTSMKSGDRAGNAKPEILKIPEVVEAFRKARLQVKDLEFFNANSDPDRLLGKPNQYSEKAIWKTTDKITHAIEVFGSEADLQARKSSIEASAKPGEPAGYVFTHKNILVHLHREILPETAAKFESTLKSL